MFAPSRSRTIMPLALLAAVLMTCLQGAAFAGEVPMQPTNREIQISTAGLNLANPAVVQKLEDRIRRAARQVCAPQGSRDLNALSDRPACEKAAIAAGLAKRDVLVARAQAEQLAAQAAPAPSIN